MVPKAFLCFLLFGAALAVTFPTSAQCTTLCTQYMSNCSSTYDIYTDQTACEMECSRFPITTTCVGKAAGCSEASNENSYDCRYYHLLVAATAPQPSNNDVHCVHSTPLSSKAEDNNPNGLSQCQDPQVDITQDTPVSVPIQDLCNNLVATCGSLFGTAALTMQYCYNAMYYIPGITDLSGYPMEGSPFPMTSVTGADNFLCRRYHVDVAGNGVSGNAALHCPHAFTGADQCGSSCDYYCDLVQNVCSTYATTADCMTACNGFATDSFSSALPTTGNTLNCRIYHATVAAQGPSSAAVHCPHVTEASTADTCGKSGAFSVSASLFLVAVLAFFSLN